MYSLDLRLTLFAALVAILLVAFIAVWVDRRFGKRGNPHVAPTTRSPQEHYLGPLVNDLAHELRTPLAVLLTHLEIQRAPNINSETKLESIRLMQAETRRMSRLVSNVLELGELAANGLSGVRPLNLRVVAADVVSELMPLAQERNITLTLHAPETAYWIKGDEYRLKQVLLNLVDNALKFSRSQDRVDVTLDHDHDQIKCSVCDTGPGIPVEHLPHLTRQFYRVAGDEVSGSGLGLALVANILSLHGSTIEITSESEGPSTGTCARFLVPVAQMEPHP